MRDRKSLIGFVLLATVAAFLLILPIGCAKSLATGKGWQVGTSAAYRYTKERVERFKLGEQDRRESLKYVMEFDVLLDGVDENMARSFTLTITRIYHEAVGGDYNLQWDSEDKSENPPPSIANLKAVIGIAYKFRLNAEGETEQIKRLLPDGLNVNESTAESISSIDQYVQEVILIFHQPMPPKGVRSGKSWQQEIAYEMAEVGKVREEKTFNLISRNGHLAKIEARVDRMISGDKVVDLEKGMLRDAQGEIPMGAKPELTESFTLDLNKNQVLEYHNSQTLQLVQQTPYGPVQYESSATQLLEQRAGEGK